MRSLVLVVPLQLRLGFLVVIRVADGPENAADLAPRKAFGQWASGVNRLWAQRAPIG